MNTMISKALKIYRTHGPNGTSPDFGKYHGACDVLACAYSDLVESITPELKESADNVYAAFPAVGNNELKRDAVRVAAWVRDLAGK